MPTRENSHHTHGVSLSNIVNHFQSNSNANNPSPPPTAIQRTYRVHSTQPLPNQFLDDEDEEAMIGAQNLYRNCNLERNDSRFSLFGRTTSRPSSSHSRQSSTSLGSLFRTASRLSRPPTYQQYDNPADADQHRNDIERLHRLEELYRLQHGNDYQANRTSNNYSRRYSEDHANQSSYSGWKEKIGRFLLNQFRGLFIALWMVVFVFVGCLTVFLPLPEAAYAMWAPLVLYVIGVLIVNTSDRRRAREMATLRQQVGEARRRRIQELLQAMNLPENHYFEIQDDPKHHGHPVMTLLPPPPEYQNQFPNERGTS
ncbi:hypothetical protein F4703DRAFT_1790738 [Phycomyces blakesleeanus]